MMAKIDDQRSSARAMAEELLTRRKQQEAERIASRERNSRAQDEKTARLRALRLAKEAAERNDAKGTPRSAGKKAKKTV